MFGQCLGARGAWGLVVAAAVCAMAPEAGAQPTNVRSWYAQGQVFIVWEFPGPPASPFASVEVYASAAAQVNTAFMTRLGRVFHQEYTGDRLRALNAGARLTVPTPGGAMYTLAANEGVFAYTPRANGNQFFAVVNFGSTVVGALNSAATAYVYDPVNDPVRPHPQFAGVTPGGHPYTAYVVFAEGRNDHENRRPDVPVMGNSLKNGVPHVFTITRPVAGLPLGPAPCVFAMHGGGGEYELFRPGVAARANMSLGMTDGIVVTPDDNVYARNLGALDARTSGWFGYDLAFDPFSAAARTAPPNTATVVNFTQRRVYWIMDWLLSARSPVQVDPDRIAMVGHSNGARGTSHLTRLSPGRFCAAVLYCPPFNLAEDNGLNDYLRGDDSQNLATNLPRPGSAGVLGMNDIFSPTVRLSLTERDLPVTYAYFGKRDEEASAAWNPGQRAILDSINNSRLGYFCSWDEREHGVEKWDTDTAATPEPDIGQWVSPVRTRVPAAQTLVDEHRANRTYPGFFDVDLDSTVSGIQPDPGDGDPNVGDPWGNWDGYLTWDRATLVDTVTDWQCTIFARTGSLVAVDDCPVAEVVASVTPRKTVGFDPAPGTTVWWYALDAGTNLVTQQGTVVVDAEGVVAVPGVELLRGDIGRVRLQLATGPRCVGATVVSDPSAVQACANGTAEFSVSVNASNPVGYRWEISLAGNGGPWQALPVGTVAGVGRFQGSNTEVLGVSEFGPAIYGPTARFRCVVTNLCGAVTTASALLTVCMGDYNCDGGVDGDDVIAFFADWDAGLTDADVNRDGGVDGDDVIAFFEKWDRGC
ncbi:MAG: GC-type dockerin domain-anchored protein [Phycisphaerales bacterium]